MHDEILDIEIKKSSMICGNQQPKGKCLNKSNDGYCLPVERNETRPKPG